MDRPARWANLVTPSGAYDRAVISRIAHATARAERDCEILVAAGISVPHHVPLGETRAWRAHAARKVDARGLRLVSYRGRFSRALADGWGFAKARRANNAARERDQRIIAALRAARQFLSQPARVMHEGERCRAEHPMTSASYNDLNGQLCAAIRLMGGQP